MTDMYPITDTLSEPLAFQEELGLLRKWRNEGDQKSREILIKSYILFAVKRVGAAYPHVPQDGVMDIAHRSLLLSIDKFNPDRENVGRLSNLIPLYAKGEHRRYIRSQQTVNCPPKKDLEGPMFVSLDKTYSSHGRHGQDVFDGYSVGIALEQAEPTTDLDALLGLFGSALDEDLKKEICSIVREAMDTLPKRQRRIIELVYFRGFDFAKTARRLKPAVTREAVRQQHGKAIRKLRDAVIERGISLE